MLFRVASSGTPDLNHGCVFSTPGRRVGSDVKHWRRCLYFNLKNPETSGKSRLCIQHPRLTSRKRRETLEAMSLFKL